MNRGMKIGDIYSERTKGDHLLVVSMMRMNGYVDVNREYLFGENQGGWGWGWGWRTLSPFHREKWSMAHGIEPPQTMLEQVSPNPLAIY